MNTKMPWFLAAAVLAVGGFCGARIGSQSVAVDFADIQPGKQEIRYEQPNLLMGNAIGLFCLVGVGGSLWKATESKAPLQPESASPSKFLPSEVFQSRQQEEVEDFNELARSPQVTEPKIIATDDSIFERMFGFRKRHLLIPVETGGGKTSLLLGAIEYSQKRFGSKAEFLVATAKPAPWLGLEDLKARDGKPVVLDVLLDRPETIEVVLSRLQWVQGQLVGRQKQRAQAEKTGIEYAPDRLIVILDEWNQMLATALEFDRQSNRDKEKGEPRSSAREDLIALVTSFLLLGREDEVAVWLIGQDHQVQNAAINTGYQKSFGLLIPGVYENMLGLEAALTGRHAIMPVEQGRGIYADAVAKAKAIAQVNPLRGVCYSNLKGHEILIPPDLSGIKRKRLFGEVEKVEGRGRVVQFKRSAPVDAIANVWDEQ